MLKLLSKSIWTPLGLIASTSATDAAINKKIFGSGSKTLLKKYIMKLVKSPEESYLLIKGVNETIKNEAKEQKGKISHYVML